MFCEYTRSICNMIEKSAQPGGWPVVIEGIPNQQLSAWQSLKTDDAIKQELARV
jgi:hypothetical protein